MAETYYVTCEYCNGTGRIICSRCNGTGKGKGNVDWNRDYSCIECNGTGKKSCFYCGGSGSVLVHDR